MNFGSEMEMNAMAEQENGQVNEQELIQYIAEQTKLDVKSIQLVLKHEQKFMDGAKANAQGEVEIDSDELVDYIVGRPDVKLDELKVESILDAEMDYFMDKGLAGYID
ncbi:hypothetical protein [Paenibacillus sp. NPDC058174]|uniref:hypothetical protein n=1 Tax=Paenibacillus sp. NPDC058174 TaxID=3346366 RepID=UPI0036D7B436